MAGPTVYLADGTTTIGIGQSNGVTSGNLTRYLVGMDWGTVTNTVQGHPAPYGKGFVRTGSAIEESRIVSGAVVSIWASTNVERNLLDEVNDDLPGLFAPGRGAWDLRVDRTDSGGSTISRILTVDTVSIPSAFSAADLKIMGTSYGWSVWPFALEAAFPLWRDREDVDVAELTVANSDATTTEAKAWSSVVNSGMEACGLKVVFSEDTAGEVASIAIACTQFGTTLTWTDTEFAVDDYVDFFVADPQSIAYTTGNGINAAGSIGLARGTNSGTIQGTGTNSPAFKVTMHYRQFWRGF